MFSRLRYEVALLQVAECTPTLSLTTAVKLTRLVWSLVLSATLVESALKLLMVGFWLSLLLILTVTLSVAVFPAASVATIETTFVLAPKFQSP